MYKEKNAEILGVSFDSLEENKIFAERGRFPFKLLSDTDRKIGMQYGACDSPKDEYARRIAYLIDEQGKIKEAHPKVDPKSYPQEQLGRL